jgi:hypothetical protein
LVHLLIVPVRRSMTCSSKAVSTPPLLGNAVEVINVDEKSSQPS